LAIVRLTLMGGRSMRRCSTNICQSSIIIGSEAPFVVGVISVVGRCCEHATRRRTRRERSV